MKASLARAATAAALLGALGLVGCASGGVSLKGPAGTILQAANSRALSGSFQVAFSGQLRVDLSHAIPPPGVTSGELSLLQAELDSSRLSGWVQFQSRTQFELSFSLSPLLTQSWRVLELNGREYLSDNGTQWHLGRRAPAGGAGASPSGLGNLKTEIESWGKELASSATVKNLGNTTLAGTRVEHLQTTIAGSSLNRSMATVVAGMAGELGSAGGTLKQELPTIEALLQFAKVTTDSYVNIATGQLARTQVAVGLNLNLSDLAGLAPGQVDLPSGVAPLTLDFAANFSDYGKQFDLREPGDIVAGPLPTPSGVAGLLNPT
ncbi:MAG TPA: hypothetical protein VMV12_00200 [Candidatus Micrarchaeaceae archaeon]|nr:hypothetical protein [Candidatus Micrarchaeaceae archaeon]